eukprot:1182318-Prorocentrum_minimum.AAC.6
MGLRVVLASQLGVSLQANAHEDVATAHANELLNHVVHLLRMDVFQHISAEHLLPYQQTKIHFTDHKHVDRLRSVLIHRKFCEDMHIAVAFGSMGQ